MVKRLRSEGYWVRGVDLKDPEFSKTEANEFVTGDLRDVDFVRRVLKFKGYMGNFYASVPEQYIFPFDEIYQFAADMGGAGFIFTGENDADIMHNSASINLNVLECQHSMNLEKEMNKTKIFYSSSACMYPEYNQTDPNNPDCREQSAYPADPDSEYGWEKLFSERLYFAYNRNYDIPVRVARYIIISLDPRGHGMEEGESTSCNLSQGCSPPEARWIYRGVGRWPQTRSFLFIDECIEATWRLMQSDFQGPVNIGSEEMVTINQLVETVAKVADKDVNKIHIDGPLGVRGRNSNNDLIRENLDWDYQMTLEEGISKTYKWIEEQIYK